MTRAAALLLIVTLGLLAPAAGQPSQGRFVQFPEETLLCTVEVPRGATPTPPVDTLDEVCAALAACWQVPERLEGSDALEITIRFDLDGNGLIVGAPRHTYAAGVPSAEARAILVRETVDAIRRCTPVRRTAALTAKMVSHDIALRLIYKRWNH